MANISQTYSGDFTSFIAGKLLNAAGMAKGESDRREEKNLEKARPGSLFARALQSEFGGDLYNRTLGNFDPRKGAGETDRSTSKEGRYKAQFADVPSKSKSDLEDAEQELFKDDDSIPVKNVDAREHISKIIGVGLDVKLIQADARIQKVSNQVSSVQDTVVQTQKLLVDQTELLGAKFDTILDVFSGQLAYQQKISDEAEVRRRENELEQEKDLSTTRKIEGGFKTKKKGPDVLGNVLGVVADMLRGKRGSKAIAQLLNALKSKASSASKIKAALGVARTLYGARRDTIRGRAAFNFGKGLYNKLRTDTLEEAIGIVPKRSKLDKIKEFITNKPRSPVAPRSSIKTGIDSFDKEILAGILEVEVDQLTNEVKKPGTLKKLREAAADGLIDSADLPRLEKNVKSLARTNIASPIKPVTTGAGPKMASEVTEKLGTKAGAELLETTGKKGSSKLLGKAGKFVPGLGTGIALAEAGYRFSQGDTTGAILSLGSAIPILGWGFTAIDIARDLGYNPMGLPEAPQQFERGTNLTKPGLAEVHGTEAILGKKDRSDMLSSYQQAVNQVGSTLVSSSVSFADAVGMGSEVKSHLKSTGLSFDIVNIPVSTNIGRGVKSGPLSSLEDSFTRDIFARREEKEEELDKEVEDGENNNNENPPTPQNNGGQRPRSSNPLPNGSYASGTWIGAPGDDDGNQTGLNMNLPGGIGTPIYAPIDLIYKTVGTDGNPAVGLDGNADPLGPAGRGFGYYGAYFFEKDGKEYEVLLGHFRDLPYKGSSDGEKIPKGTLLGYQGASGRSKSRTGGVYPHITLHVNGIGHFASNSVLTWFADGLATAKGSSGPGASGYGNGGERDKAFHELAKDEALSSLTPGVNDWVKPGGRSVVSNTPWESVTDDTLLYVYADSRGVPTLGYGSAAMRGVTFETKPITVRQAKAWLRDDINRISNGLSKNIKWWNSMTDDQRAGLIMFEYNAGEGNSYLGNPEYPTFARQLEAGNIRAAIPEIQREGPGQSRINLEQDLLRSGPQQIVGPKIVGPKIVGEGKVGAGFPFFPDLTIMKGIQDGLKRSREREQNSELLKLLPGLKNKSGDLQSSSQIMEDMEDSMIQQVYIVNTTVASTSLPPVITSSGRSNDNYVDQYRMAILGA